MSKWRAERREGAVVSVGPVPQRLMDTWWLTDGKESFRMTSQFSAERLASYLNAK